MNVCVCVCGFMVGSGWEVGSFLCEKVGSFLSEDNDSWMLIFEDSNF